MRHSSMIGTGAYVSGRPYLSVWTVVGGFPDCLVPPLALDRDDPAAIAAAIAVNRVIAGTIAQAEAVEGARRLVNQPEPPALVDGAGPDGEPVQMDNPDHVEWLTAGILVDAAAGDTDLCHLLRTRTDTLLHDAGEQQEPGWELSLPPVPDLDPFSQTADWDGAVWVVRDLTGVELAQWPLRPPPVPATVTRVQLRLALAARGMLATVDAAVAAAGDAELMERWGAAAMERASPHLTAMAAAIGLTAADIDDIFREAAGL